MAISILKYRLTVRDAEDILPKKN